MCKISTNKIIVEIILATTIYIVIFALCFNHLHKKTQRLKQEIQMILVDPNH